jgi:hypothetical protein
MNPYPLITLAMPGRHWDQTSPTGGDFVVMVTDPDVSWTEHQFKHDDIFDDLESRRKIAPELCTLLMEEYFQVVTGEDPDQFAGEWTTEFMPHLLHPLSFLHATQCLAVAEYRRYARFEAKGGGRYLPLRFAAGIVAGEWDASTAKNIQKRGRPGVESLEATYGVPEITKRLLDMLK